MTTIERFETIRQFLESQGATDIQLQGEVIRFVMPTTGQLQVALPDGDLARFLDELAWILATDWADFLLS